MLDLGTILTLALGLVPLVGGVIGAWAIMRKQGDRTEHAVEALSKRLDEKLEKHLLALTSVQEVSGESMRRVLAAWVRIEEESKAAAHEREERARLQEQLQFQKELIQELKRTQELNMSDVRRAMAEQQKDA